MRVVLVAAVVVALFPASAVAADLTPDGPATLTQTNSFPRTAMGYGPGVVTGWKVAIADGGRAGTVRPRFQAMGTVVTGDPVQLPAEPGTYTFAAPHLARFGSATLGLEQATGGHAIVTRQPCRADLAAFGDPCQNLFVDVARDGQADERVTGAQLAIEEVLEGDMDRDLRGDSTEDRTDLQVSVLPQLGADCRWRVAVTVRNAGPLSADLPVLKGLANPSRWQGATGSDLPLAPLAAGETRTLTLLADLPTGRGPIVSVSSEGPDLADGDNTATFVLSPVPPFTLTTPKQQSLRKGIKVGVRGSCTRRGRVTAAFKVRGQMIRVTRTVKLVAGAQRTLTLRPTGAKLRSLKRALKGGALNAEINVRTLNGKPPVTAKTVVR
jgi:hypothetical protein